MAGAYTRSKKAAEELALQAASDGAPVVIANPTMPIGPHDYELTPPTEMIRYFLRRRLQLYVDAVLNIVDVRDVAAGLILVMERGRIGERYILGGENLRLRHLLEMISHISGNTAVRAPLPMPIASAIAATMELIAARAGRPPSATAEGVEIARRSRVLSSDKARRELGYTTRSLKVALSETISWLKTSHIHCWNSLPVIGSACAEKNPELSELPGRSGVASLEAGREVGAKAKRNEPLCNNEHRADE